MAIGRISGAMLKANLERLGTDLSFDTDLLYLDVVNHRIGINTATPTQSLQVDNVTINASEIRSVSGPLDLGTDATDITIAGGTANYVLKTDGAGNLSWDSLSNISGSGGSGGLTGMQIDLDTPTDGSLTQYGALQNWTTTTKVTNSIDDLNELATNIINDTAVTNLDFTGTPLVGGAGLSVALTITADGNPNQYTIDWGDGTSNTTTASPNPSHTYATNTGSPFTVNVTASNTQGNGAGSSISKERVDYVTIYTSDPVVTFAAYAAPTGGSPITYWDDGATIYFENTTTNTSGATVQYTWSWGDGSSDDIISADTDAGGVGGGRLAHTFATSTEEEITRTVTLTLDSHTTALPAAIPTDDSIDVDIYDEHTPEVALSTTTGINVPAGVPVTFTNNTETTIGSYADYGITYLYTWGDGGTQSVNVGSGLAGDTGNDIDHTYTLSAGDQSSGTARDYTGNLRVLSNHTGSPFISTNFTVHVEPELRASISGTAVTTSDRSGDNQFDIYDGTDYNGINRARVRVSNTTQNADDYVYAWGDGDTDNVTEDGTSDGTVGNDIFHNYLGEGPGNYTLSFTATGTPDLTAQTDSDNLTFQLNAVPSAPDDLSTKTITLVDSAQGSNPKLANGFTDNSASNPLSAGDSLNTTTARRYTTGTLDTSVVNNANGGLTGTLTAMINGVDAGNKTFTTSLNENGIFGSLVVTGQLDAHDSISSTTYPTGFHQTFDAKITQVAGSYSTGVNDQRLEHSTTGNTNYVAIVIDDLTSTPTVDVSGATLTEDSVTYNYISGIPYYSAGGTLTLSGVQIYNWIGQTYNDTTSVFTIANGSAMEGTTDSVISTQYKTYAQLEDTAYLTGGVPNVNTGIDVSNKYAIADQTITLTSSNVTASRKLQFRATNVNGAGSYAELDQIIRVVSETPSGIDEFNIPVADSLGNGDFTDDGIRIKDFLSETTDNPSFTGTTNFYTNNPYANNSATAVSGTQEASVIYGVLKYDVTDNSTNLPAGPDRSGDTGTQYFTFAFRRKVVANFDINLTSTSGVAGVWIAAPGTGVDTASSLNGWLDCTSQYAGVGVPGANTGNGGNGSNGCASTGADAIPTGSSLSGGYTMTLGSENMSNATGSVVMVRIALTSGQSLTAVSIGEAA